MVALQLDWDLASLAGRSQKWSVLFIAYQVTHDFHLPHYWWWSLWSFIKMCLADVSTVKLFSFLFPLWLISIRWWGSLKPWKYPIPHQTFNLFIYLLISLWIDGFLFYTSYNLLLSVFFSFNFLGWHNSKHMEKSQKSFKEFLYIS